MRMASSRQAAAGSVTARETSVVEACQVLTSLVTEFSDRKPVFLAEGGVIALMELLEERSTKVRVQIRHHCVRIKCRGVIQFSSRLANCLNLQVGSCHIHMFSAQGL